MTVISNSETFTIANAAIQQASVNILVLPAAAPGTGDGRLIHPTLGAYDYERVPDEYTDLLGDVIVHPVWKHTKTGAGGHDTLWPGHLKDTICIERWTGGRGLPMTASMLSMLMSFYTTPPDPEDPVVANRYIEWWPSYDTNIGYKVVLLNAGTAGGGLTVTQLIRRGWLEGIFELHLQIVDYA